MVMTKTALSVFLALPVLLAPALAEQPKRPAQTVSGRADNPVRKDKSCRPSYLRYLSKRERRAMSWGLSGSNTCWVASWGPAPCTPNLRIYPDKFARKYEYIRLSCSISSDSEPSLRMGFNFLGISNMPSDVRKRRYGKMPLRVGLWSWAEDEGRKTLHHDVAHYRETYSPRVWSNSMISDSEAAALIRKLHRADYVLWTMDNTEESSELAEIDERLREQIATFMRHCRIAPGPATRTSPSSPRITSHESPNTALQTQALRQKP